MGQVESCEREGWPHVAHNKGQTELMKSRESPVLMTTWQTVWNVAERTGKIGLKKPTGFHSMEAIMLGTIIQY